MSGPSNKKDDQADGTEGTEDTTLKLLPLTTQQHLGWTAKQGDILMGGGKAEQWYTAERGFSFADSELPHYHLLQGTTRSKFAEWKTSSLRGCELVCGAWIRPLFVGGWQHSTSEEERVYNVQSHNLFIDLRIPRTREKVLLSSTATSLEELSPEQLRFYARQHVFAGYTVVQAGDTDGRRRTCATRHHCIDWNFVGVSRPRPNKWWIQVPDDREGNRQNSVQTWKELAYAKDDWGQHYYSERWERYPNNDQSYSGVRLAMRLMESTSNTNKRKHEEEASRASDGTQHIPPSHQPKDAILVVMGDHFNYIQSRTFSGQERHFPNATSLIQLVDNAVADGELATARSWLSIQAGHGTISSGWTLDCAIPPWNEGKTLWQVVIGGGTDIPRVVVLQTSKDNQTDDQTDLRSNCRIVCNNELWELYDCSFDRVDELQKFLQSTSRHGVCYSKL